MTTTSISIEIHNSWSILFWNLTANGVYDFRQGAGHIKIFSKYFEKKKKEFFLIGFDKKTNKSSNKEKQIYRQFRCKLIQKIWAVTSSPIISLDPFPFQSNLLIFEFPDKTELWSSLSCSFQMESSPLSQLQANIFLMGCQVRRTTFEYFSMEDPSTISPWNYTNFFWTLWKNSAKR